MSSERNLISFSLYGDGAMYIAGAVRNLEIVQTFYEGWIPRFYVGRSVPPNALRRLYDLGADIVEVDGREDSSAMFWRFRALTDKHANRVVIRDADSRFSEREARAVQDWIASDRDFHIMRDHPAHNTSILGGLWGAKPSALTSIEGAFNSARPVGYYGEDQEFLDQHVYPIARRNAVIHDSFYFREPGRRPFPTKRERHAFVGEAFDENDRPDAKARLVLEQAEKSFPYRARLLASSFARAHGIWPLHHS